MINEDPKFRYVGSYSVSFPASYFNSAGVFYKGVEIHQKIHEHDVAIVRIRAFGLDWFNTIGAGAPIKITYSKRGGSFNTFVGYVTQTKPVGSFGRYYEQDVICVAASRVLRKTDRVTYKSKTGPEIVAEIAKKFKFNAVTAQHGYRKTTVVQHGETYWEFLSRLATRIGYAFRVEQTSIIFMPISDVVKMYSSRTPYYTDTATTNNAGVVPPNVQSFKSWVSDTSDDPHNLSDSATITAVIPESGQVVTATATPGSAVKIGRVSNSQYVKYPMGVAVHSLQDAKLLAKGAADNGAMAFDTELLVAGDSVLRPYQPVSLVLRDKNISGTWIVKEVVHRIKEGNYTAELTLSTDSFDGANSNKSLIPIPAHRSLSAELSQGVGPDVSFTSILSNTTTGFTVGQTGAGGTSSIWTAF